MKANAIEATGKTVEEAVESALKQLNAGRDEVEVEVLDAGSGGFLGIGAKPARVTITKNFDPVRTAQNFLREMFATMDFAVVSDIKLDGKHVYITLSGSDAGSLIGKKGQVMDALQYLLTLIVNKGEAAYAVISLDIENYRERRKETLENLAFNLAKKVKATRRSARLEPMSSFERRVIHSALQGDKNVTTHSEGSEPYRNVVITLKRDGDSKRPHKDKTANKTDVE